MTGRSRRFVLALLLAAVAVVAFCIYYVGIEDPLYYWDWGAYHRKWASAGEMLSSRSWRLPGALAKSVRREDYNLSSIVPLLPLYLAFGPSRTAYIAGVATLYLIPAAVLACMIALASLREEGRRPSGTQLMAFGLLGLLFPPFWAPTLRGMPDVIGLIPLGVATLLVLRSDVLAVRPLRVGIAVGLSIWLAFLFRRWYAYSALSLVVVAGLFALLRIAVVAEGRRERIRAVALAFPAIAVTAAGCAAIFQSGLLARILATSYREAYAAYHQPVLSQLAILHDRLGSAHLGAILVGLGIALWSRNRVVLFCACCSALTFLTFATTQAPGPQHGLPMFFWLLPAATYGLHRCLAGLAASWRPLAASAALAVAVAAFVVDFVPGGQRALSPLSAILPRHIFPPHRIENFPEYRRLIADLRELTRDGDKVAVFASNEVLSDDLLEAIDPGLGPAVARVSQVDARDGLRLQPFAARYAVVTDPVTLHLPPETQRVISIPSDQIRTGTRIGGSYDRVRGPYRLASGVTAFLFARTVPLGPSEIEMLSVDFRRHYPDWAWDGANLIFAGRPR